MEFYDVWVVLLELSPKLQVNFNAFHYLLGEDDVLIFKSYNFVHVYLLRELSLFLKLVFNMLFESVEAKLLSECSLFIFSLHHIMQSVVFILELVVGNVSIKDTKSGAVLILVYDVVHNL